MIRKEAVVAILGSPVAYYAAFAKVLGGVEAGILTSQFFYWYGKGHNPEGWVYKTQAEIEDETGLSRRNQETARKKLRDLKVLEEKYTGMPAKLYYRLNLDRLFELTNEWFTAEVLSEDESQERMMTESLSEDLDGGIRHPRMYEPAIQGCTNPPSKNARTRHPRMYEPAIQECANPPHMDGGFRHTNTENTTKTTTENTAKTTTLTATRAEPVSATDSFKDVDVDVGVTVSISDIPDWIMDEFQFLLGQDRHAKQADLAALTELATHPEHIINQAFDAARVWLEDASKRPIRSLGRWLVGTARRKLDAEEVRGSEISRVPYVTLFEWDELPIGIGEEDKGLETSEPGQATPEQQIWSEVLQDLALQLPSATYDSWIRGTWIVSVSDGEYVIGLPNAKAKDWLENRLIHTIQRTLASFIGQPVKIRFQVP